MWQCSSAFSICDTASAIGRNQARCPCVPGLLSPAFKPCMPIPGAVASRDHPPAATRRP
jgi:hypothetical protein